MQIVRIKKGEESRASALLSNRTDSDFEQVDATVREVIETVRAEGDAAVRRFTEQFGGAARDILTDFRVSESEMEEAWAATEDHVKAAFEEAAANIRSFHEHQLQETWTYEKEGGIMLGQLIRPIRHVGVYIPGGAAPLSSTVLMNIIPAKIAGCPRIVMCSPAGKDGKMNKYILAAAKIAGADEIYRIGGAQAIAAMAYGTETIRRVDKITGPGSAYIARAKKYVYGTVDIDMIAGPSEVMILADRHADPAFLAADMLSQAEHDVMASSMLVTDSADIAAATEQEIARQLPHLDRPEAAASIKNNAAIFITEDLDSAFLIANDIAPEHLELALENAESCLDKVDCAGAVLLGHYSPEPLGDYFAGPNHTLPTSGTARFASPLGVYDFLTRTSIIRYSGEKLKQASGKIIAMAESEGLTAHANAIRIRFENN